MKGGKIRAVAMRLPSSFLEQTDANMLGMSGDVYNSNATAYSRRARTVSRCKLFDGPQTRAKSTGGVEMPIADIGGSALAKHVLAITVALLIF